MQGRVNGEKGLYVTFSETRNELITAADSHGWSLDGIEIFELATLETGLDLDDQYTMFQPSEVELNVMTRAVLAEVERTSPVRVVFDSLSEMQLLSQSPLRFRHQILALKQFLANKQCTVLMIDDKTLEVERLAASEPGPRRDPARADGTRIWHRATAAARHQDAGRGLSRRLP